jgi:ABC-type bacteriocin/lantibiotic exporter with double-glycine peptidase domain
MFRCATRLAVTLLLCGVLHAAESREIWLDVPFILQEKNACGAASLAMLQQYWEIQQGKPALADARRIEGLLYSEAAQGIYASEMKAYLERQGYQTFAFQGEWQDFRKHLEQGRPLIVALRTGEQALHYVVIVGIDEAQNLILKNDPAERKLLKQERSEFEKQWKATGNWTLLAVPRPAGESSSQ